MHETAIGAIIDSYALEINFSGNPYEQVIATTCPRKIHFVLIKTNNETR